MWYYFEYLDISNHHRNYKLKKNLLLVNLEFKISNKIIYNENFKK